MHEQCLLFPDIISQRAILRDDIAAMLFHADLQGNRQHALKYARRGEDDHHAKFLQAAQAAADTFTDPDPSARVHQRTIQITDQGTDLSINLHLCSFHNLLR